MVVVNGHIPNNPPPPPSANRRRSENQLRRRKIDENVENPIQLELISETATASTYCQEFESGKSLKQRLLPALRLLQILGFFRSVTSFSSQNTSSAFWRRWRKTVLLLYYGFLLAIYLAVSGLTVFVANQYRVFFGMLNAVTVSGIITGIKPLICCVNFIVFNSLYYRNKVLLKALTKLDRQFTAEFKIRAGTRHLNIIFYVSAMISFVVAFGLRMVEFFCRHQAIGEDLIEDVSIILVALINVLVTQPLVYFFVIYALIFHYTKTLVSAMQRAAPLSGQKMTHFYQKFIDLTELQSVASDFFGPWIFCSLGWSVFSLCLTIYFVTQSQDMFSLPVHKLRHMGVPEPMIEDLFLMLFFNCIWSLMQILVVCIYFAVLFILGTSVNEETRKTISVLLAKIPPEPSENDRFQITCFVQKMSTQYTWGVTIWRAFAIERGAFFTIISLIFTYAILLLRLKAVRDNGGLDQANFNLTNHFNLTN